MKYLSCFLLVFCAACSGNDVKNTLGMSRKSPDEFRVVSRPPLSVPKEFYLYPPDEAQDYAVENNSVDARAILFDATTSSNTTRSLESLEAGLADSAAPVVQARPLVGVAEESLLQRIGADKADETIRDTLRAESQANKEVGFLEKMADPQQYDTPVVDAAKERERLMEAKKKGEAVNEGEVPEIREKTSVIDWLF